MLLFICTIFTFLYVITRKGEIIMYKINIQEENPHGTPYFPFQALSQKDFCGQLENIHFPCICVIFSPALFFPE